MGTPLLISFGSGLSVALVIGAIVRILVGMKLNLFLVNHDSAVKDQSLIPVTTEGKKASFFRTLFKGNWREDVDITLLDYSGHTYHYRIGYHLWWRFYLVMEAEQEGSLLNGKTMRPGKRHLLRTGSKLTTGDRAFFVLVTPNQARLDMHKELYDNL